MQTLTERLLCKLRAEVCMLACAAADRAYRDMLEGGKNRPPVPPSLDLLESLAVQMQVPALKLIERIEQWRAASLAKIEQARELQPQLDGGIAEGDGDKLSVLDSDCRCNAL